MKVSAWFAKLSTFDGNMAAAEVIDAYRVFPRFVLIYALTGDFYLIGRILQFYFDLPSADKKEMAVATLCGTVITALAGFIPLLVMMYNNSARDWAAYHNERKRLQAQRIEQTVVASSTTSTSGGSQ